MENSPPDRSEHHRFGGLWTTIKLDMLRRYLESFSTALKNKKFRLVYIDAFAGTGTCTIKHGDGDELDIDGSAKIALLSNPPFDKFYFIEERNKHVQQLEQLCAMHPEKSTTIFCGDANEEIIQIIESNSWRDTRAVLFLDPYGLSVEWNTLKRIAQTEAIDLWFLFSISGLYRQAAKDFAKIDEGKAAILDKCLGTPEWRTALYAESPQTDLFSDDPAIKRTKDVSGLLKYMKERLDTIFPSVSDPMLLPPRQGAPLFALYFIVSNPSKTAIALSRKIADHILKLPY